MAILNDLLCIAIYSARDKVFVLYTPISSHKIFAMQFMKLIVKFI